MNNRKAKNLLQKEFEKEDTTLFKDGKVVNPDFQPCSICGLLINYLESYAIVSIDDKRLDDMTECQFCSLECWKEFIKECYKSDILHKE